MIIKDLLIQIANQIWEKKWIGKEILDLNDIIFSNLIEMNKDIDLMTCYFPNTLPGGFEINIWDKYILLGLVL